MPNDHPPITRTTHPLAFERLSAADFERLCLWLVQREGYEDAEHLGASGADGGRDVVAWRAGQRVVFQCKREKQLGPKKAEAAVEKVLALPAEDRPQRLVLVVACGVSAEARRRARKRAGSMACEVWARTELDERAHRHPELVREFFGHFESGETLRGSNVSVGRHVDRSIIVTGDNATIYQGPAVEAKVERSTPEPSYADDETRVLSQALEDAYRRHEELTSVGEDTTAVQEEIFDLRRRLREGGQLKAGDFLHEGRFRLLEPLGKGGFSKVWKAFDRRHRGLVALKVLHGQYAEDRTRRERFFRGARKMSELQHQGIVRVIESKLEEGGYHFFVMEFVGGGDLRRAVLDGRLSVEDALRVVCKVAEAVEFAHQQGVIHRDVKPANILLEKHGQPKLTDFDLVRAFDTTGGTRTGSMLGTFLYMAPEAMKSSKDTDVRADVYSLAMTAAFALHGAELPATVLRDPGSFLSGLECGPGIKEALIRGASWDPAKRFGSIQELSAALEKGISSTSSAPVPPATESTPIVSGRSEAGLPEDLFRWIDTPYLGVMLGIGPAAGTASYLPPEQVRGGDQRVELWREIPAGRFLMGDGGLQHEVRVESSFSLAAVPVTNAQYAAFKPDHAPRCWEGVSKEQLPQHPVVNVNWHDAMSFCRWLSETIPWARGARLPTEEEWEYGCRTGTQTRYWSGEKDSDLARVGWYRKNSGGRTHRVGGMPPNPWGLYDVHGNVWEWTLSEWMSDYSGREEGFAIHPSAIDAGDFAGASPSAVRVVRGGSYWNTAHWARSACRSGGLPRTVDSDRGFRVLLPCAPETLDL